MIISDRYAEMIARTPSAPINREKAVPISSTGAGALTDEMAQKIETKFGHEATQNATTLRNAMYRMNPQRNDAPMDISRDSSPYDSKGYALPIVLHEQSDLDTVTTYNRWRFENNLLSGNTDNAADRIFSTVSSSVDIPKEGFLDTGIDRYRRIYGQLAEVDMDAHVKRLSISNLDRAFVGYCAKAFEQNGVEESDARRIGEEFCEHFRKGVVSGASIDESYLNAIRVLDDRYPNLLANVRYSAYPVDLER